MNLSRLTNCTEVLLRTLPHLLRATKWSTSNLQSSPRSFGSKIMATYATMVDSEHYMKRKNILDIVNSEIESQPDNKFFAVVHLAGRQHKVTVNDLVVINHIPADLGSQIVLNKVLLAGSENFTIIGRPLLAEEEVKVVATVVEHTRLKKVVVFKKKRRKNYKRTKGHRQNVTVLRINQVDVSADVD